MSHLTPIYAVWEGNAEAMAADIRVPGVTVRQWRNRGNIPTRYWQAIVDAAARRGVVIELGQFINLPGAASGALASDADPDGHRQIICAECDQAVGHACPVASCPHFGREAA